jgi:uncharacterized protein involved in outer membrane biogenesis
VKHLFREGLTALAGLVIAALLAALVLPRFIDWDALKPRIEARLSAMTGMAARIEGPLRIGLLPRVTLMAGQVRLGGAQEGVSADIARLDMAIPISGLLRGELRVGALALDGVDLRLMPGPDLSIRLPQADQGVDFALDAASVTRGRIIIQRGPAGDPLIIAPVALSFSTPASVGPWRIEGEVAGEPVRFATGLAEASGDAPAKLFSDNGRRRIEIDGMVGLDHGEGRASLRWSGLGQLTLKGENGAQPAPFSAALRGRLAQGVLTAEMVSLDLAGAGRLEGAGEWRLATPQAAMRLSARRFTADALADIVPAWRGGGLQILPSMLLPQRLVAEVVIDQLLLRGEEFAEARAAFEMGREGLSRGEARATLAGLSLAISDVSAAMATGVSGSAKLEAQALQRVALAAARMGLPPAAADALSALGALDLSLGFNLPPAFPASFTLERMTLSTPRGKATGRIAMATDAVDVAARLSGIDLSRLPELAALLGPVPSLRRVALDLAGDGLRFGTGAPGDMRLKAERADGRWRIDDIAASGFGGLTLRRRGDAIGGAQAELTAPDAAPVLALALLAWPEALRDMLLTRRAALSPLSLMVAIDGGSLAGWRAEGRLGRDFAAALTGEAGANGLRISEVELAGGGAQVMRLVSPLGLSLAGLRSALLPERASLSVRLPGDGSLGARMTGEGLDASWRGAALQAGGMAGPLSLTLAGADAANLSGSLSINGQAVALEGIEALIGATRLGGELAMQRDGMLAGKLGADRIGIEQLAAIGLGVAAPATDGGWSAQRFAAPPALPRARVALSADALTRGGETVVSGLATQLEIEDGSLRLEGVQGQWRGARLSGQVRLGAEGGLRSLGWRLALAGGDLGSLTGGGMAGALDLQLEGGGAGETPQRLVNTLAGSGEARLSGGRIASLSPAALGKLTNETDRLGLEADISGRFSTLLAEGAWPLGDTLLPLTLSGGALRLAPIRSEAGGAQAQFTALFDLRRWQGEARADVTLAGAALSSLRPGELPQASVIWRGAPGSIARNVETGAIRTLIAARELKRELDRVEAFEADARERALFARRLRLERETREREAREKDMREKETREREQREADAAREEARRILGDRTLGERGGASGTANPGAGRAPGLPPPLQILPVPLPAPGRSSP